MCQDDIKSKKKECVTQGKHLVDSSFFLGPMMEHGIYVCRLRQAGEDGERGWRGGGGVAEGCAGKASALTLKVAALMQVS